MLGASGCHYHACLIVSAGFFSLLFIFPTRVLVCQTTESLHEWGHRLGMSRVYPPLERRGWFFFFISVRFCFINHQINVFWLSTATERLLLLLWWGVSSFLMLKFPQMLQNRRRDFWLNVKVSATLNWNRRVEIPNVFGGVEPRRHLSLSWLEKSPSALNWEDWGCPGADSEPENTVWLKPGWAADQVDVGPFFLHRSMGTREAPQSSLLLKHFEQDQGCRTTCLGHSYQHITHESVALYCQLSWMLTWGS